MEFFIYTKIEFYSPLLVAVASVTVALYGILCHVEQAEKTRL